MIADFLQRVAKQSVNSVEQFMVQQFVEYVNWLNLVEFLGFETMDFVEQEDRGINVTKFDKFLILILLSNSLKTELGLKDYGYDRKFYFIDVPQDNVWFEMTNRGITCGIVCGAGSRWRAQHLRDSIEKNAAPLRQSLGQLRASLNPDLGIVLRVHSWFHYSRFRRAWLGYIQGEKRFPEEYEGFALTLTNRNLNACDWIKKDIIQERFATEIENSLKLGHIAVDDEGKFPAWKDITDFLQYAYFHVDVEVPSSKLVGASPDSLSEMFKDILQAEHDTMQSLLTP